MVAIYFMHGTVFFVMVGQCMLWGGPRDLVVNDENQGLYKDLKTVNAIGRSCKAGLLAARQVMRHWASEIVLRTPARPLHAWNNAPLLRGVNVFRVVERVAAEAFLMPVAKYERISPFCTTHWRPAIVPSLILLEAQLEAARVVAHLCRSRIFEWIIPAFLDSSRWNTPADSLRARSLCRSVPHNVFLRSCRYYRSDGSAVGALNPTVEFIAIVYLAHTCRRLYKTLHARSTLIGRVAYENAMARQYRTAQARASDMHWEYERILRSIEGITGGMAARICTAITYRGQLHYGRLVEFTFRTGVGQELRAADEPGTTMVASAWVRAARWLEASMVAAYLELRHLENVRCAFGSVNHENVDAVCARLRNPAQEYGHPQTMTWQQYLNLPPFPQ